jgi:adenosylcobyric acid synthase
VLLLGDIDRGGVIAQIVGTQVVLGPEDRARIVGFAVNRFRGDPALFVAGMEEIERRTGWPSLGLIAQFDGAWRLPAEDVLDIAGRRGGPLKIAVPQLPRIANFDDLDPLKAEPGVTVEIVAPGRALPGDAALVLIPGSKSTIADLAAFRAQGWDIDLAAHVRRGGHVLGLCGGYQMLGREIRDAEGVEGPPGSVPGLGLLDVVTEMVPEKRLTREAGRYLPTGAPVSGYEIHIGRTEGPDRARGFLETPAGIEGAASADGRVMGCYWHGIFAEDRFRGDYLARIGGGASELGYEAAIDGVLDDLAAHLAACLDLDRLLALAGEVRP